MIYGMISGLMIYPLFVAECLLLAFPVVAIFARRRMRIGWGMVTVLLVLGVVCGNNSGNLETVRHTERFSREYLESLLSDENVGTMGDSGEPGATDFGKGADSATKTVSIERRRQWAIAAIRDFEARTNDPRTCKSLGRAADEAFRLKCSLIYHGSIGGWLEDAKWAEEDEKYQRLVAIPDTYQVMKSELAGKWMIPWVGVVVALVIWLWLEWYDPRRWMRVPVTTLLLRVMVGLMMAPEAVAWRNEFGLFREGIHQIRVELEKMEIDEPSTPLVANNGSGVSPTSR